LISAPQNLSELKLYYPKTSKQLSKILPFLAEPGLSNLYKYNLRFLKKKKSHQLRVPKRNPPNEVTCSTPLQVVLSFWDLPDCGYSGEAKQKLQTSQYLSYLQCLHW